MIFAIYQKVNFDEVLGLLVLGVLFILKYLSSFQL